MVRFGIGIVAFSFTLLASAQTEQGKVPVDGVAGHYRFDSGEILSLEAFGEKLTAKTRGMPQNVLTPSADGRFSYSSNSAYLTFATDTKGTANSLQYHFEDRIETGKRIDDAAFDADTKAWDLKIKDQVHTPECAATIRGLVDGMRSGAPDFTKLSPALSRTVRAQMSIVQPRFVAAGATKDVQFKSVDTNGNEILDVSFENGSVTTWRVLCLPNGYITSAAFRL